MQVLCTLLYIRYNSQIKPFFFKPGGRHIGPSYESIRMGEVGAFCKIRFSSANSDPMNHDL